MGQPLEEVLTLLDRTGHAWVEINMPYGGLPTRTGIPEQSWLLPDGQEVLVAAAINRVTPGGAVYSVAVSMRSGRGRARLDRERSDLVATVAHELRSPLTGVKGFVQALINRWDKLNDEQKKLMLSTVSADADRLSRLITELLDVARIDTGRLSMFPRGCDASLLVGRVVDSVRAGTARSIVFAPDPLLPEIHADPDKFTQVVTNLVENAVRHGEGTVTVTLARDRCRVSTSRGSSWSSTTRAAGSPRRSGAGCSPSSGPTGRAAAPGSACTSSTASPAPTTVGS